MKQEKFSGHWGNRQRNVILLIMITVLILYIAVPIYGVIKDARQGETVFVIEGSSGEGNGLLDKIIDFVLKSKKITVPAIHIVDLKGIVLYSDKTPYSNGIIELLSTPRYTRTAKDGSFIFRAVEAGKHNINVIDESGNILASCNVDISIDRKTSNHVTTSFSKNTYVIHVSVNVELLEIKVILKTDKDGNVQGISSLEATPIGQPEDSGTGDQTDLDEPDQPGDGSAGEPDQPGEEPEQPVPPDTGGTGSSGGGGGGGGGPTPNPFQFEVYDSATTSFGSTAAAQVNIFGTEKHIAPGMKGSYRFSVDNTKNSYRSLYTVDFTKNDNLPAGSKIPMVFRLKAGSSYVAGDAATWCTINQLDQDTDMAGNSKVVYTLEWYWPEGSNDNLYAELDSSTEYSYTLRIEVTAQQE